jgi:hypothetical protein
MFCFVGSNESILSERVILQLYQREESCMNVFMPALLKNNNDQSNFNEIPLSIPNIDN